MSQYDFGTIDPGQTSGAELAELLGDWRDAVLSGHKGASRPNYAVAGTFWVNNANTPFFFDGASNKQLALINAANTFTRSFTIANSSPGISLNDNSGSLQSEAYVGLNPEFENAVRFGSLAMFITPDSGDQRGLFVSHGHEHPRWRIGNAVHDIWHEGNLTPDDYVKRNGENSGQVIIQTNDADFVVRDGDGERNYIWRDHSAGALVLGSSTTEVKTRADTTVEADLTVTGGLEVESGPFQVDGSRITLIGGQPEIIFDDNHDAATPTTHLGINPDIGGEVYHGAFGIIHRPTSGPRRGITIHESVGSGPLWHVSSNEYRIFTNAISHGSVGALAFLKNTTGAHLRGDDTAAGSQLRDTSTDGNNGDSRSGTWRALAAVSDNAGGLFVRIA